MCVSASKRDRSLTWETRAFSAASFISARTPKGKHAEAAVAALAKSKIMKKKRKHGIRNAENGKVINQ